MTRAAWGRLRAQPWRLWMTQLAAVIRLELKKSMFHRRVLGLWLVALLPVLVIGGHVVQVMARGGVVTSSVVNGVHSRVTRATLEGDTGVLAGIFQFFYLRLAIFFGAMGVFTWLVRGEMVENTLHYYLLAPIRREVLGLGKFLSGLIACCSVFVTAVFACFVLMYLPFGPAGSDFVFRGPGLGHLFSYLGVTVLACCGFGALFLALSLVFRNPAIPGAIVLGWETISGVLPAAMQKLSVTYYLKHLCPVSVPVEGIMALFTVVTEPVAPWAAVLGLLLLTAAVLVAACWRMRTLEISYHSE